MKRITYILSTVFLLLLITCGGAFAAAPEQYVNSSGEVVPIRNNVTALSEVADLDALSPGWYYWDNTMTINSRILLTNSSSSSGVNIIISGPVVYGSNYYICVPRSASLNFYQAASNNIKDSTSSLSIDSTSSGFVIGNIDPWDGGPNVKGNFGNITFVSGTYTVKSPSNTPAVGSNNTSGGTIQIDQAATLTTSNNSTGNAGISIGVVAPDTQCNISVNGGILNVMSGSAATSIGSASVGESGKFTVANQGFVWLDGRASSGNIDNLVTITQGVVSWYNGSTYDCNIGGEVTLPLSNGAGVRVGGSTAPTITFEPDSNVTIGTLPESDGTGGQPFTTFNGLASGTKFENYGTVSIINADTKVGGSGNKWNNYSNSNVTINEDQILNALINNSSAEPGEKAGNIVLNGLVQGSITNYGTVTVGPVGYSQWALLNEKGGTVSSQNPNYYNGGVWNMSLGSNRLSFYTTQTENSNQKPANTTAVTQIQDVGFSAFGSNGVVLPSFFNYTLTPIPTTSNSTPAAVATFDSASGSTGEVGWKPIANAPSDSFLTDLPASYSGSYYLLGSGSSNWALVMTPPTTSTGSWGLYLVSDGASNTGVYNLNAFPIDVGTSQTYPYYYPETTATPADADSSFVFGNAGGTQTALTYQNSNLTDSVAVVVNTNTVSNLEITVGNQVAPSPYTVNLDEGTNVVDFGVIALGPNDMPVTNYGGETWTITYADGSPCTNVASVNAQTGVVRFIAPTNQILYLNVTAQGVTKTLPIIVKGTIAPDSSIEAVNDPLYLTATAPFYDLDNNIKFMPSGIPASSSDANLPDITFTIQDNPGGSFIDSSGQIVTTNSNNTSTYTVLATTTIGGQSKTATFEVTFTGQTPTEPTGIAAETNLTFDTIDAADQNVNAHFTPATTSINQLQSGWYFEYNTSDPDVAVVDSNGNVTPVGVGTCTITTTVEGATAYSNYSATTNVTVTAEPSDIPATGITVTPEGTVYLAPPDAGEGTKTSETLTAALEPEDSTDTLTAAISPESVATLTDNNDGTYTVNAVASGTATITFTAGDVEEQVAVVVNAGDYAGTITTTAVSPDTFTVTVSDLVPNPALPNAAGSVQNVSIFTWTGEMQTDMQCVRLENTTGSQTSFSHTFTVNGNENHQWYYNADKIYINVYASDNDTEGTFLGAATHTWMADQEAEASNRNVAYITYQEV